MPKPRVKELIHCRYYRWRLGRRHGGVFAADGRSNAPSLGRHSLGVRDRAAAIDALHELDLLMAVRHGLASPDRLTPAPTEQRLTIAEGRARYERHVQRPAVTGGPRDSTAKRYRAVFDKFETFAAAARVADWADVDADLF